MTRGQTLCPEFVSKFLNLTRNLKVEISEDVSSSSSDEDFFSRIEIESDSETEEDSDKNELPSDN
jgi:hypothetical protein